MTMGDGAANHEKTERAQFEAIGRFVQAFEAMNEVCRRLLALIIPTDHLSQEKLNLVLHHNALTAWPLFELARNVAIMHAAQREADEEQLRALTSVFSQASREFQELVDARNTLLHGTWRIGWRSPMDAPTDRLSMYKFKPVQGELRQSATAPTTTGELLALVNGCEDLSRMLEHLLACLINPGGPRVSQNFKKVDGRWCRAVEGLV